VVRLKKNSIVENRDLDWAEIEEEDEEDFNMRTSLRLGERMRCNNAVL
jgi:hypothetical protein